MNWGEKRKYPIYYRRTSATSRYFIFCENKHFSEKEYKEKEAGEQ
jgi:hypothetical protein